MPLDGGQLRDALRSEARQAETDGVVIESILAETDCFWS
jgi:hypothetical protein